MSLHDDDDDDDSAPYVLSRGLRVCNSDARGGVLCALGPGLRGFFSDARRLDEYPLFCQKKKEKESHEVRDTEELK